MKCMKCGRQLKDAKSIERGYGPVCWGRAHGTTKIKASPSAGGKEGDINIPGQMELVEVPGFVP